MKSLESKLPGIRKIFVFLFCWFLTSINSMGSGLVPMPNSIEILENDPFIINEGLSIGYSAETLEGSAKALQRNFMKKTGVEMPVVKNSDSEIFLEIDPTLKGPEHYKLEVSDKRIGIKGSDEAAVFRGVMTLNQLLSDSDPGTKTAKLPSIIIDDSPRLAYRALMLDPARNFLPVEDVKFFIDQMSKYKFNVLQLHLSDDQGWRIQMDSYPELSSEQSYSKEDLKNIIDYASQNYIEVVPELDIPGHTAAFLKVFPELGCDNHKDEEIIIGKTDNRMLCAAKPEIYEIYEKIIGEVAELFPSNYIHLGGDEAAIPKNWAKCESCLELMNESGFTDPSQLMIPFFGKMLGYVKEKGKTPILWCELNNIYPPADDYLFPYPEDVTLVTWRNGLTPTCIELTAQNGHPLIMAPGEYAYLDYPQMKGDLPEFNNWGMPVTTLAKTYEFDPLYGLPEEKTAHIQGIMGTLWGEAIKDINRLNYMAFPRALALSEAGWTLPENRDWESFKLRLYPNLMNLMQDGVSFRVPFEIVER